MVPYVTRQEHQERMVPVLLFGASRRSLGFVTTWSAVSGFNGGLRFVQVFAADAAPDSATPGRRLLLNERPLPPEERLRGPVVQGLTRTEDNRTLVELAPPQAGPRSLTLAEGLASLAFRTLARPEGEGSPARLPHRSPQLHGPVPAGLPIPTALRHRDQPALEPAGALGLPDLRPGPARGRPLRSPI